MDIAITLPRDYWNLIVSGIKTIELRKNNPHLMNKSIDRVYVVIKGTTDVVGFFYFESTTATSPSIILNSEHILKQIAVPKSWIQDYIEGFSLVYLWGIGKVFTFDVPRSRDFFLNIKSNPQSYVYLH